METARPRARVEIIPMAAAHIERLAEIETECFSMPWSRASLAEELSNPLAVFLVALADGEIAGYVGMMQVLDEGYMANLAVTRSRRGRGVATALMARLMEHAAENALRFITLEVRESNAAARQLYARFAFEEAGGRKNFYGNPTEDAVIMTRYLSSRRTHS